MLWDPTSQASLEISPIWLPVMEKEFKLCELGLLFLAYFCSYALGGFICSPIEGVVCYTFAYFIFCCLLYSFYLF
jgi:hypothetical protein